MSAETIEPAKRSDLPRQPHHILVVEDDSASLLFLKMCLEDAGYTVDGAECCGQALECAAKRRPNLLITDMQLPDGDGANLYEQLLQSANSGDPRLHAVALSGFDVTESPDIGSKAPQFSEGERKSSFDAFMTKPVDLDYLLSEVAAMLKKS